jgi:hypothetical protein
MKWISVMTQIDHELFKTFPPRDGNVFIGHVPLQAPLR